MGFLKLLAIGLLVSGCAMPSTSSESQVRPQSLVLTTMDGERVDFGAEWAAGRQVALVFWQPWCSACKAEAPHAELAASERGDRTRFVGVVSGPDGSVDDFRVRQTALELGLTYPQVRDRDLALTRWLTVRGVPAVIVLGPDGEVEYRGDHLPESWDPVGG